MIGGEMAEETNQSVDEHNGPEVSEGQKMSDEVIQDAVSNVEKELDEAKKEIETLKDSWLRERAEFQNYKRRTANDLLHARKDAIKKFAEGLTSALDNLERVSNIPNPTPEVVAFVEGIKMVQKEFYSVLEREGIKRLDPKGMSFDPMMMEAIASEESAEYTEETVVETYQAGYYHEEGDTKHSIRPARVKVGKPASE